MSKKSPSLFCTFEWDASIDMRLGIIPSMVIESSFLVLLMMIFSRRGQGGKASVLTPVAVRFISSRLGRASGKMIFANFFA